MNKQNKNIEAIFPLSPTQEGILFHTLYAPESGIYFQQLNFTLQGNLNILAFQQAWQRVVERHQALRTLFLWENRNKPLQVVLKSVNLPWETLDLQQLPIAEQQQRLLSLKQSELEQPIPLNQAPLMRWKLVQLQADICELIWSHHHLVTDGWSMSIILQEVLAFYQAIDGSKDISLTPVRDYRDYIAWLNQQDFQQAKTFWQKNLDGFIAPTPLTVDCRATSRISLGKSAYEQMYLPENTTAALQLLAKQNSFTLNTIVQGVWALLLSRYSGESDIVFGVTVSGRPANLSGVESMVGLFINTVPARIQVPEELQVLPWLQQLFSQQMERDYSYSPLVEIQANSQIPEGMPLFESLLVFENYPLDESSKHKFGSLEITNITGFEQTNYPLTAIVIPGSSLLVRMSYDPERFDVTTISRMLGHFQTLLEEIATNPFQRLYEMTLLTSAEKNQLLVEWNDTKTNYPDDSCIGKLFAEQAEKNPEAIAVVYEEEQLTYGELNIRANQLAHHLQKIGVGTEILVGLCIERSIDMVVAMLGILKAGGAYLPLDPAYPQERLDYMLVDAAVSVLVTQSKLTANLSQHQAKVIYLDTDWKLIGNYSSDNPTTKVQPTSLAYVIYTSGSTGKPKGVAVPHQAIVRLVRETNYVQITPNECIAQASNANFDAATFEIWGALLNGAKLVVITKEVMLSPEELQKYLIKYQITILFITTALLDQLVSFRADIFKSLRTLLFGGEAVNPLWVEAVLKNEPPKRLLHVYGPTESTTFATWNLIEQVPFGATNIPIGRPLSNTTLYVLDSHQQPVPIGVTGELYIGGDGLARGYLNRPELTTQKFVENPFSETKSCLYKTGDLVRYLANGNIEFLGRIDSQVKIRGFRIELGEIESLLSGHSSVQKSVVVVREDDLKNKHLVAYIVTRELKTEGKYVPSKLIDELQFYLKQKLPNFMLPSFFILLDVLPLTPNGKIDKDALTPPDPNTRYEVTYVEPKTDTEKRIATVWQELLLVKKVGVDDNFFNLGGHSLLATQMISRLRAAFEIDLPLRSVFDNPTVAALANFVTERQLAAAQSDALEKILNEIEQLSD